MADGKQPRKRPAKVDRPSTIDRMPKAVQDEIYRLRFAEGRHLDEILAHLKAMGAEPPSRTALGRHVKALQHEIDQKVEANLRAISPAMQMLNQVNGAVMESLSGVDGDQMLGGLVQLLMSMTFQMSLNSMKAQNATADELEENPELAAERLGPLDLTRISRTFATCIQSRRHLQAMKIEEAKEKDRKSEKAALAKQSRAVAKAEADSQAAVDEVAKVVRQRGVSAESFAEFRKFMLGEA